MKLTLIISELLNSEEENISDVTDDLIRDYALKTDSETDLKNNSKDPSFPLFK